MFNALSDAQHERLSILAEECGEVVQAVCKILRHGYESRNPDDLTHIGNRHDLEVEIGHVSYAVKMLTMTKDLDSETIAAYARNKSTRIERYLHCEENRNI